MIKRLSIIAFLASSCAFAAHASESQFNAAYCGSASCDGASVSNASIWQQMRMLGTTEYLGGRMGNTFVDEAALLAGARLMGVTTFDEYLRTGIVPEGVSGLTSQLSSAMGAVSGIDTSAVTGSYTRATTAATASLSTPASDSAYEGAAPASCSSEFAQLQVSGSNAYIEDMTNLAKSEAGFTRKDGKGAGKSFESEASGGGTKSASVFGLSCLERIMTVPKLDVFFSPPNLQKIIDQASQAACDMAMAAISDIARPTDRNIFDTLQFGGFMPGMNAAGLGGKIASPINPSDLLSLVGQMTPTRVTPNVTSITELFGG